MLYELQQHLYTFWFGCKNPEYTLIVCTQNHMMKGSKLDADSPFKRFWWLSIPTSWRVVFCSAYFPTYSCLMITDQLRVWHYSPPHFGVTSTRLSIAICLIAASMDLNVSWALPIGVRSRCEMQYSAAFHNAQYSNRPRWWSSRWRSAVSAVSDGPCQWNTHPLKSP